MSKKNPSSWTYKNVHDWMQYLVLIHIGLTISLLIYASVQYFTGKDPLFYNYHLPNPTWMGVGLREARHLYHNQTFEELCFEKNSTWVEHFYENYKQWKIPIQFVAPFALVPSILSHTFRIMVYDAYYQEDTISNIIQSRLFDYFLSAPLMVWLIATITQIGSWDVLLLMIACIQITIYLGYVYDRAVITCLYGQSSGTFYEFKTFELKKINWTPYYMAWYFMMLPWIIIFVHFGEAAVTFDVPVFVYLIVLSLFFSFSIFGIVPWIQYHSNKKNKKMTDNEAETQFYKGEIIYDLMSLISKSFLVISIFISQTQEI